MHFGWGGCVQGFGFLVWLVFGLFLFVCLLSVGASMVGGCVVRLHVLVAGLWLHGAPGLALRPWYHFLSVLFCSALLCYATSIQQVVPKLLDRWSRYPNIRYPHGIQSALRTNRAISERKTAYRTFNRVDYNSLSAIKDISVVFYLFSPLVGHCRRGVDVGK